MSKNILSEDLENIINKYNFDNENNNKKNIEDLLYNNDNDKDNNNDNDIDNNNDNDNIINNKQDDKNKKDIFNSFEKKIIKCARLFEKNNIDEESSYNSNITNDNNEDTVYSKFFNLFNDYYDVDDNNNKIKESIKSLSKNIKSSVNIKEYQEIDAISDNFIDNYDNIKNNYKDIKKKLKNKKIKNIFDDFNL